VRLNSQNANNCQSPLSRAGGFVKVQAFAKINLFLDVVGKKNDGYHDIFSLMQTVSLCDELIISFAAKNFFEFSCDVPNLSDENNLVVRAAKILIREYDLPRGISIALKKKIPVGAGLAGGSSDCAATLLGINNLFGLNIPREKLASIGKSLGADVPFCLAGGTAIVEGIGEKITPLPPHPPCFIVIAVPKIFVSTAEIFKNLDAASRSFAESPRQKNQLHEKNFARENQKKIISAFSQKNFSRSFEESPQQKNHEKILRALSQNSPGEIAASFYNVFTPITSSMHPQISDLIARFETLGALGAQMSGTGPSVFAYFDEKKTAETAFDILKNSLEHVFLCTPI